MAQQSAASGMDSATVQTLLQRISQLEAKVAQLEAAKPANNAAPAVSQPAPAEAPQAQTDGETDHAMEGMETKQLLHIRGFSDITFSGGDHTHDNPQCTNFVCAPPSFSLGQLNLFITSTLSERFKFLTEMIFEAGPDNAFGVDLERMLLQYSQSDYFNVVIGRYHTAIGYYNTAYHHSSWFQTTTGRPYLFQFEDHGGILPIHSVGASVSGAIPSGPLGLHYVFDVANGRASRSYVPPLRPPAEAAQNVVDENSHKAVNLELFVRPQAVRGLQVGISAYRDVLQPGIPARIGETILAAHAIFSRPSFEWLNEAMVIRHTPVGGRMFNTPGGYTQISKRFGSYRPYFRYQYLNVADQEPVFGVVGFQAGPSVGVRYDATEYVAVKLQYDRTELRRQPSINTLALQVSFTF